MDYASVKNNFFYGMMMVAFLYIIFCFMDDNDPRKTPNEEFALTLLKKLKTVEELDAMEIKKIQDEMDKILKKESKLGAVAKGSLIGAIKGGLTGCLVGGAEGALAGSIVFGTVAPVIIMIENMM